MHEDQNIEPRAQTISAKNRTVVLGKTFALGAKFRTKMTYKSAAPGVVTVSTSGKVTAKGIGRAKITITALATDAYKKSVRTVMVTVKPARPVIKRAVKKRKGFTIRYGKVKGGVKYRIAYRKGSGKWKYRKSGKNHLTIKGLSSGKKYTVKVRAFKKVGSRTYYSSWSKSKTVKIE